MNLKRWQEVCTTKEERLFFLGLTLDPQKDWRSADGLSREMGWPVEKVREMLDRFTATGIVLKHPTNPNLWGYWEKVQARGAEGPGSSTNLSR